MLIESRALQFGHVEGHGRGGALVLAVQIMAREMVFGQCNQLWWGAGARPWEDLGVDMARELLYTNFVEACFGWYCKTFSACVDVRNWSRALLRLASFFSLPCFLGAASSAGWIVARPRRDALQANACGGTGRARWTTLAVSARHGLVRMVA